MADERSLMRPLRSDSLKPRPCAQAVWPPEPPPAPVAEAPGSEPEPELFVEEFIPAGARPLPDLLHSFAPELRFEPDPLPQKEDAKGEPFDLDAAIAAILAGDDDDEDDALSAQDALPTEQMPRPACVPLTEAPAPERRRKGWLWLLLAVLLIGGAYAAQHFGLLALN